MIELIQHSIIDKVEIDVHQTNNLNTPSVLYELVKLLNVNIEKVVDEKVKQINKPKQTIFSIEDLCQMYRVCESTIQKYRKSGELNCCCKDQKVWFTQEHIDAFNWINDSRNKK